MKRLLIVGVLGQLAAATIMTAVTAQPVAAATPKSFFVDPVSGSDTNTGTTTSSPWRTLYKVNSSTFSAGTTIYLKAGLQHTGDLIIGSSGTATSPITVTTYGSGAKPVVHDFNCVTISGDFVTVKGIKADTCARAGFNIQGAHDTVTGVEAVGSTSGVWVKDGSSYATVSNSTIHDNTVMVIGPGADDDYGAFGVEVNGDYARITGNTITGHAAPSPDYGSDGSAVEVFGAVGTTIDHNIASDNKAFSELGGQSDIGNLASDTTYAYNQVTGSLANQTFLEARGSGQFWGPTARTLALHNTVSLTGAGAVGVGCYGGCGTDVLDLEANIISAEGWVNADGPFVSNHNIYRGGWGAALTATDSGADPLWVSPIDLQLQAGSPALNQVPAAPGWTVDLKGTAVPQGGAADLGAYERIG